MTTESKRSENVRTIWKYRLPLDDLVRISMPVGAQSLCVQMQGDVLTLWAMVDEDAPTEIRRFVVAGTGHPLPAVLGHYLGTVQPGVFVWHVFEGAREERTA